MPRRSIKRRKTFSVSQKRPIDKQMRTILMSVANAGTSFVNIWPGGNTGDGVTFPGTITGLRWDLGAFCGVGGGGTGGNSLITWAVVKVREGITQPSDIMFTNGATTYAPEQDVMAFGSFNLSFNATGGAIIAPGHNDEGSTKTMRKMQNGDRLFFIARATNSNTQVIAGTVEFFYKS